MDLTRRDLLTATAGAATMAAFPAAAAGADAADAQASALLDRIAERQLADQPGDATQLGLDKGAHAALKSRLGDNSAAGQHTIARHLREGLTQLNAVPIDRLGAEVRTHVDVIQASFSNRARRLRVRLWRCRHGQLAQLALCRDPECRRYPRHAADARQRSSDRERRRRRSLSRRGWKAYAGSSTARPSG
jgi:uncharacterized protein (DUF885 family)